VNSRPWGFARGKHFWAQVNEPRVSFSRIVPEGSSSRNRLFDVRRQRVPGSDVCAKRQSTVEASSEESASVLVAEATRTPKRSAAHFRTHEGHGVSVASRKWFPPRQVASSGVGKLGTSSPKRCCPCEPTAVSFDDTSSTEVASGVDPWSPRLASRLGGHHSWLPQAASRIGRLSSTRDAQRIAEAPSRGSFPFGETSLGDRCVGFPPQHRPLSRFLTSSAV
jgi:hypothetical protein